MPEINDIGSRKADHIRINLEENVSSGLSSGLERLAFSHQALPEIDLETIEMSQVLFNKNLQAPILISSMTGGTLETGQINLRLAEAAQFTGIAMGLGSQRAALEDPKQAESFRLRKVAPDILLFANLGAVQLNYHYTIDDCQRAVEMAEADALFLHLNALQEALQPEGNTRFSGLFNKIEAVCRRLPVPVIVKEVGWGISAKCAQQLASAGVSAIDVAGAGGTSWSQVEMHRIKDDSLKKVAGAFLNWGIPTVESIKQVKQSAPEIPIFASGGLRNGIDIAKCIALGATLGGMAGPFLKAATQSTEVVIKTIQTVKREIQICMFVTGAASLFQLKQTPLIEQ